MADRLFSGFFPETIRFLTGLEDNNNKQWFEQHRRDYDRFVIDPMRALVSDLSPAIIDIDPLLETRPAVNKTISRIYRDTRFSRDKTPFKTTLWIVFKRPADNWQETVGFFMEYGSVSYRYGMGFYQASRATMENLRQFIDEKPDEFLAIVSSMDKTPMVLEGEDYKRLPGAEKTGVPGAWYRKKSFYIAATRGIDDTFFSADLAVEMARNFTTVKPLYDFLWSMVV